MLDFESLFMASVYQHSRGKTPYWIAVFTDESGKRCHRSTKTTDRTKATATAEKYQRMADTARGLKDTAGGNRLRNGELVLESFITATQKAAEGTFSEHDAREVMNRTLEATGQNPMNRVSSREFLTHWIESKEISKSAGTSARYRHTVETFLTHWVVRQTPA